ncbi:7tm 7 domain containing protein, partial [Asbolus verrucosus]
MDYKLLNLLLRLGDFFAITPSLKEPQGHKRIRQVRLVLIKFFITVGTAMSIYYKDISRNYHMVKKISLILTDLVLYAFNMCVMMEVKKFKEWHRLLNNLKMIDCFLKCNSDDKKESLYTKFLVLLLIIFIITIYMCYYWTVVYGFLFWQRLSFTIFESYSLFIYTGCIYVILRTMLSKYKALKDVLKIIIFKNGKLYLREIEYLVSLMSETVCIINDIFGRSLALMISFATLQLINYFDYGLSNRSYAGDMFHRALTQILFCTLMCPILVVILTCDSIVDESQTILSMVFRSRSSFRDPQRRKELYRFAELFSQNRPQFTAARYFSIEKSTILKILETILTFLIVLVQF